MKVITTQTRAVPHTPAERSKVSACSLLRVDESNIVLTASYPPHYRGGSGYHGILSVDEELSTSAGFGRVSPLNCPMASEFRISRGLVFLSEDETKDEHRG